MVPPRSGSGRRRRCLREGAPRGRVYHSGADAPGRRYDGGTLNVDGGAPVEPAHHGLSPDYPSEALVTVTFAGHEGNPKLTLHHAILESVPERSAIQQGWTEMFDRLAEELAKA